MRERISKRVLGFIAAMVGLTLAVIDGFPWWSGSEIIIGTVFTFSAALLGIDALKRIN